MKKQQESVSLIIRLLCIVPYSLPLLEGFQDFGHNVIADYPFGIMKLYKKTLMPIVMYYSNNSWVSIVIFFVLYYFIVSPKSPIPIHRMLKFNTLQAIILYTLIIVLANIFRLLPADFRFWMYGSMLSNTLFWVVLSTVFYAISHALRGTYSQIPVISEGAKMHIDFGPE
uniref:hypothetical protein n=1 Tax=Timspurckia oligopyrenoides TaxID=708627 RepID=UPI001FCD3FE9|nr:hypothetical protein MW591_pgp167 [Timspurckia oligopyrenoides]UNJ17448.1 hypothetical protein [Timspurckia oligopyrenoides]